MFVINLTSDVLELVDEDGQHLIVEPSGVVTTLETVDVSDEPLSGLPVTLRQMKPARLPDPKDGMIFVVSAEVEAWVNSQRDDVFAPGEPVDGGEGRPLAYDRLRRTSEARDERSGRRSPLRLV